MFKKISLLLIVVFGSVFFCYSNIFAEEEESVVIIGSFVENRDLMFVIDQKKADFIPCKRNEMENAIIGGVGGGVNKIFSEDDLFGKYSELYKITVKNVELKSKRSASDVFTDFVSFLEIEEKKDKSKKSKIYMKLTGGIFCANLHGKFVIRVNFIEEEIRDFFDLSIYSFKE